MIELLKKYKFNILSFLIFIGLLFFFIPNEELRYLQPDIHLIESKSNSIVFWVLGIIVILLLVFGLRKIKKVKDIFYLVFGLGIFSISLFFLLQTIFLSAILFINTLSNNTTVDNTYIAMYVDGNNKNLLLWDFHSERSIQADKLIKITNNKIINATDTVIVSFTKGLFGFNYDPKVKDIKNKIAEKNILAIWTEKNKTYGNKYFNNQY